MKTNKLLNSAWTDFEEAGSHLQYYQKQPNQYDQPLNTGYITYNKSRTGFASNDASYESELSEAMAAAIAKCSRNNTVSGAPYVEQPINVDGNYKRSNISFLQSSTDDKKTTQLIVMNSSLSLSSNLTIQQDFDCDDTEDGSDDNCKSSSLNQVVSTTTMQKKFKVSERVFMTSLLKHTGIALAIIIPLAAFSAYAAPVNTPNTATQPSDIIYKSTMTPTTVDRVDLQQYTGTWYEIGRLPMYFQRNCASDVTATYTSKTDGTGIIVTNKCQDDAGSVIVADGFAKPVDNTGSKLKVTFLPSWIRWLPVGRADYWVLARDANYQTALVGTPDKKYLWLLARTPNISQQTYSKYRQIAQQQGYDLKEFTLTVQTAQNVKLVP